MSIKLADRRKCGPNGFLYHEKRTGWKSWEVDPTSQWDFNLLCQRYREHAVANPGLALETDLGKIEAMMDFANAMRYLTVVGGDHYIVRTGDQGPKALAPLSLSARARQVAAGLPVLVEWLKDGAEAVSSELANQRAAICSKCPKNEPGDWTRFFTVPASNAIHKELERRRGMKLSTPYDDSLRVCSACLCPLPLKVHIPIDRIRSKLSAEVIGNLAAECWIPKETA